MIYSMGQGTNPTKTNSFGVGEGMPHQRLGTQKLELGSSTLTEYGGHLESHLAESEPSEMALGPYALKITSFSLLITFKIIPPKSS